MTDARKADASDWSFIENGSLIDAKPFSLHRALIELRARVEALEGFLLELTSTVPSAALDAAGAINDHADSIETLEQRLTPPMAEVAADPAPASEPPPLDVPQVLARDWINRHGTFRPTPAGAERTGTDWGMVITEAARWGQRQSWDARPEQPAPAADVAPLLWVLWHHMGGNSPVGQPIRKYLGMGQFERMSKEQVEAAKGWGSIPFQVAPANTIAECGGPCEQDFRLCDCGLLQKMNPQRPPVPTTEARPDGLVERVVQAMINSPHTVCDWKPEARAVIREVAAALLEWHDSDQLVHTAWEAAKWLEQEAGNG